MAASCTAVYLLCYLCWRVGLALGWWVFGVVAPERGCEGGFMAGGVFEELQRSCWGIWCGRRSNGCCLSILRKCKNVLLCWGVTLCFAVVVCALRYGWSWMSVSVQWGVLQSLKCDCLECIFVFIEPYLKASTSLPHIHLLAIGASSLSFAKFGGMSIAWMDLQVAGCGSFRVKSQHWHTVYAYYI